MKFTQYLPRSVMVFKNYKPNMFTADLMAGVTVAIVALPLAMAFAIASGVEPERGLFTAIVAGFIISAFGGSKYQIGGPTGAFVVVLYAIMLKHGYDGLVMAVFLAGIMLMFMGFFRLGNIIKFIPYPVTVGFTTGIALIIFTSQIKDFLGLPIDSMPADFVEQVKTYGAFIKDISFISLALGVFGIFIILACKRFCPKIPGPIVVIIVLSIIVTLFNLPVDTIGSKFESIPNMLPSPALPIFSLEKIRAVFPDAVTIAILGAIESLLSAVVADGMTGDRHHSNKELVAQGSANILSIIFGGIAATGAIARTVTNIKAGAFSPLAGMFHALFLLAFMFFLSSLILLIPLCALSAILVIVAWNMSEFHHFKSILLNSERHDAIVLVTTFSLTVFIDLNMGVQTGIMMAALLFIKRMIDVTQITDKKAAIKDLDFDAVNYDEELDDADALSKKHVPEGVEVYEIGGPFFFGIADKLKGVLDVVSTPPKVFILRMRKVPMIDETGYHALEEFYDMCKTKNTVLILSGVSKEIKKRLVKKGMDKLLGAHNITNHIDNALIRASEVLEYNISNH
ncbi:MAG: STAS domain-containing protein [Campylobacteraceae bacterium]|jgi:SulP family sulfate permease|nr:STAS domain-containing protein [Campylobacteraceae bacterium]